MFVKSKKRRSRSQQASLLLVSLCSMSLHIPAIPDVTVASALLSLTFHPLSLSFFLLLSFFFKSPILTSSLPSLVQSLYSHANNTRLLHTSQQDVSERVHLSLQVLWPAGLLPLSHRCSSAISASHLAQRAPDERARERERRRSSVLSCIISC